MLFNYMLVYITISILSIMMYKVSLNIQSIYSWYYTIPKLMLLYENEMKMFNIIFAWELFPNKSSFSLKREKSNLDFNDF